MNGVNKTLYIPLYGKAYVSKKGIILHDSKAEEIWASEGFGLKGKSKSKWLAYYMGMRSSVFDNWLRGQMENTKEAVVIHIGCGMDSRVCRIGMENHSWYDVDFPEVIEERRRYCCESSCYQMIGADVRNCNWLEKIPKGKNAIIVMEGISMYLTLDELQLLLKNLSHHFGHASLMMDCYTVLAAKASKYKNPINDVGVTEVYGIDNPRTLEADTGLTFIKEHEMTPEHLITELCGIEKCIFKSIYGGKLAKKLYRLYEFESV